MPSPAAPRDIEATPLVHRSPLSTRFQPARRTPVERRQRRGRDQPEPGRRLPGQRQQQHRRVAPQSVRRRDEAAISTPIDRARAKERSSRAAPGAVRWAAASCSCNPPPLPSTLSAPAAESAAHQGASGQIVTPDAAALRRGSPRRAPGSTRGRPSRRKRGRTRTSLGSPLSKRASTISLMCPGRADMTAIALGEEHRLLHVVGDKNHGLARALPDAQEFALHQAAGLRVERAERLVHQQDPRVDRQGAGDRGALLHAARELRRVAVLEPRQADELDELAGAANPLARAPCPAFRDRRARSASPSSTGTARNAERRCRGRGRGRRPAGPRPGSRRASTGRKPPTR